MNKVNEKIINAVIKKASIMCPDSLLLIGVYGSVLRKDTHEKSDLDLLILIDDDKGWSLGSAFILEDTKIGYDIYCTNWDGLINDSKLNHAHISKLMNSEIVYINNQKAYEKLMDLRKETLDNLKSPKRLMKIEELIGEAISLSAFLNNQKTMGEARLISYEAITYLLDAIMIYHSRYFQKGSKNLFDELKNLPINDEFSLYIKEVAKSKNVDIIIDNLQKAINEIKNICHYQKNDLIQKSDIIKTNIKELPGKNLIGTYEEMYSNWYNKVINARVNNDVFSSFANMCSLSYMINDLSRTIEIGQYNIMDEYDPDDLSYNQEVFEKFLETYEKVYLKAGIKVKRYKDVDEFILEYLK